MSLTTGGTYEPASSSGLDEAAGPVPPAPELASDLGPPPESSPPATPLGGADAALAQWAEALLDRQQQDFAASVAAAQQPLVEMFDARFADLHDPYRVFVYGFLVGGAAVIVALVLLLGLGLLFLHGLSVIR